MQILEITSEADAWAYVEAFIEGHAVDKVILSGWPKMEIAIKGEEYCSSLTAGQMEAYLEFQRTINRAYAAVARGHYDARYLTTDEEQELTLRTTVKKGSSLLDTDLTPLIQALSGLIGRASATEVFAIGIVICLGLTAPAIVKQIYEGRARELELRNQSALIEALTKRDKEQEKQLKLYDKALAKLSKVFPAINGFMPQLTHAQLRLLNSIDDADEAKISGVEIDSRAISKLNQRRARRSKATEIITDKFLITSLTKPDAERYQLLINNKNCAISARLCVNDFGDTKLSKLIRAFHRSQEVHFEVAIYRFDQSTLKGTVQNFTVPRG